jgi:hypothetical protein
LNLLKKRRVMTKDVNVSHGEKTMLRLVGYLPVHR